MFDLEGKFGELKENAKIIKNNINKLNIMLENEKASVLELQKEIQNSYDLIMKNINASNRKEEQIKLKQDELNNLRKKIIERDIENKALKQNIKFFNQDNKKLQEKLYQKEKDELSFKILTNETSTNIEKLKNKINEQNKEMQQYKIDIEDLKDKLKKQTKTNIVSISNNFDIRENFKFYYNEIQIITNRIKNNLKDEKITSNVIERMFLYFETIDKLSDSDSKNSQELERLIGITSSTIRKDFSLLKIEGTRGQGYNAKDLKKELEKFLFCESDQKFHKNNINTFEEEVENNPEEFKTYYLDKEKNNDEVIIGYSSQESELESCLTIIPEPLVKDDKGESIKKEPKKYIDLLKESKLDMNNIQKFVLDRSKSLEDPEELSTNDWKKVLNFGVSYKILTNREIQQLKQISLMLGNFGYKSERSEILNKVKENGFEISLYKVEDWEKVLEFLVKTKGITKEVKDGFEGIFKKYKKKKIFKLEQLKFILPYLEKYKENRKKIKIEGKDSLLEIEEDSCLTPFGKAFNKNYIEREENEKTLDVVTGSVMEPLKDKIEKNTTLVEPSNENIKDLNAKVLAVESDEWHRAKHWLSENKILECNHQKKVGYYNFCDVLNESKRFNGELTIGQMNKAREIYMILEENGYDFTGDKENKKGDQVNEIKTIGIEGDQSITSLILEKFKKYENPNDLKENEWHEILRFGIYFNLFGKTDTQRINSIKVHSKNNQKLNESLLENGKKYLILVKNNGFETSLFTLDEWDKVISHLKKNNILKSNVIDQFYNISNESEETGFFSIEQLKFISPYFEEFRKLVEKSREKESGELIYELSEEFKESKYNLSEKQNRILRELKLFDSKNWKDLSIWSDNRLLIENEDIEVLNSLINGRSLEKFKELELIGLIELYEYLVEEGFNIKGFNLEEEKEYNTLLKELKSFDPEQWRELYDWSDKKLLIQHEDHKLLAPLVNGNPIDNMEESDLINLSNLYKRLLEKGFKKNNNDFSEKNEKILNNEKSEEELLEEVRSFRYNEWNQMFEWGKKKKKLKNKDLSLLTGLAIRSNNKELSQNELILGLEVYFILMSEGFELVKEKDIDDFLMQFMDEEKSLENEDECKVNKIINSTDDLKNGENTQKLNFKVLMNKGLESGFIEYTMLEQINYEKEIEINDHFEAIEELEDRGIVIKY